MHGHKESYTDLNLKITEVTISHKIAKKNL